MKLKDIFFNLKKNLNKKRTVINNGMPNPHKHWIILLRFFLCVALGLIVFSFYLLSQINGDKVFQVSEKPAVKSNPINDAFLKKITDLFNEKAQKETDLKTNPPSIKDLSL